MGNMSYCRFENTNRDVQDCMSAINDNELSDMNEREQRAFVSFIMNCKEIAEDFEDYNENELREFIEGQQDEY